MSNYVYDKERLSGKTVLLRVDFNVEIKNNTVVSDFRLRRTIPTIKDLQSAGAKIILISHIDDKEGGTLEPVARTLLPEFPKLRFIKDIFGEDAKAQTANMKEGDVILFENLRKWEGEKANDPEFTKHLALFAEVFINEAFSVSHREHSSIVSVPKLLPSFIGPAFREELKHLSTVENPKRPFFVILGGAKFETKMPLLQKFLEVADSVAIGGAIANDFFKAKGYFMGDSLVSDEIPSDLPHLLQSPKLLLPVDVYTSHKGERFLKSPKDVGIGEKIMDVGDKTVKIWKAKVSESSCVLWNGPLGKAELGFSAGTEVIAKAVAYSKTISIVGGGDVVAAIEKLNIMKRFTFVSSGGGAMLEFLSSGTLVGLEAVKDANHKVLSNKNKGFFARLSEWF